MAITSELKRPDTLPRAQFFITRILGGENLPDYDFITLPTDRSLQRYTLDDVQEWMKSAGAGYPTYSERFDGDYLLTMLRRMLLQAASGSTAEFTTSASRSRNSWRTFTKLSRYQLCSRR